MKLLRIIQLGILFICLSVFGFAQNNSDNHNLNVEIPEVALLGLISENSTNINLNTSMPTEAGSSIDVSNVQNSSIWINYSSIIARENQRRKVVAVVQGDIPQGLKLKVEASGYSGSGKGNLGEPVGEVALSNQPADVISGIGSCFTGKGINNGHFLTYKLELDEAAESYALLTRQNTAISVVYTLTDLN